MGKSVSPASDREYKVYRIENGIVIDHVVHWGAYKVIEILGLRGQDSLVTVGFGLTSDKMGKKDLLKVENLNLTQEDINRIAIVAPTATINRVEGARIVDKFTVRLPDRFEGLIRCANPACITRHEPVPPRFLTLARSPVVLRCHYCTHVSQGDEIEVL
ncbi:MAG: aspartate carbamoyltransferase regulatory subunit [Armatimonadetes bacterium]|nr:aspartate carbamoyltransferase regulatory subunit [Armatimonadota bacterium]